MNAAKPIDGALRIEEHRGAEALQVLRDEWRELYDRSAAAPFLSWEWIATWHHHLGAGRTPRILCARRGGALVGLLPLAEERITLVPGAEVRRLSFLGERWGGADYLDVLALEGEEAAAAQAIYAHLNEVADFDVADLDGIAADSPSVGLLAARFAEDGRFRHALTPRHTCPQVALEGTWREVLKRSKRGDNFKRRLRQLRELDGFERRVVRDPGEAVAAFERFLVLHEARWEAQGGSDAMGRPALQAFHRDVVVRLAERGWLRFEEIWVEGACRASIYGIDDGPTYCFYQSGYDPAWAKRSVGLVCLGLSVEDALERGITRYDFLRGTETYKFDWATGTRETVAVRVAARSLPATLLAAREGAEAAARAAAHALLPSGAVDLLRRLRRNRERQSA
ncbi:GNAT family N-acetyltransferase [Vulgatibacter sp.]|uniref:GNAT family N-acetyltransferase n=1 Tax=Vulgatibacter sp. TaxID=1971226 RepID=UPI003568D902